MADMRSGTRRALPSTTPAVPAQPAPIEFLDLARIELAPIDEWSSLFDETGWPDGLAKGDLSHESIVAAFSGAALPDLLLDALQCALDLGTPDGVDELLAVAASRGVTMASLGVTTNPLTFVLRLWCRHRGNQRLAVVLRLAQVSRHKRSAPPKSRREFAGAEARPYPNRAKVLERFRPEVERALNERNLGPILEFLAYDEGRVVTHVLVYAGREQEHLLATKRGREIQRLRFVVCDVIQYDPRDGRLTVCSRSRSLVATYRQLAGQALFGDPEFFAGENLWSLEAVRRDGAERLLNHNMGHEISVVVPHDVAWRQDDSNRAYFDGDGCFAMLDAHPWRTAGSLTQVSLDVHFWGAGRRRARVVIRPPNRLEVQPERFRGLVDRYLRNVGVRNAPRRALDLWAVTRGVHDDDDVVEALGASIDRLGECGLLRSADRTAARDPASGLHQELVPVDLPDGAALAAVSEDETATPELLPIEVGAGSVVEVAVLADLIARDLALASRPQELSVKGFYDLGTRGVADSGGIEQQVRVFVGVREPPEESVARDALRDRCRDGSRPVLLVPAGRRPFSDVPSVECTIWCPPFNTFWPRILAALGLHGDDPWAEAEPGMVLLLHREREELRIDGVVIEEPGDGGFFFALALALQKKGKPKTAQQIAASITRNSEATPQAASMARNRLLKAIDASMKRASTIFPPSRRASLFVARKRGIRGWEIGVPFQILGGPRNE